MDPVIFIARNGGAVTFTQPLHEVGRRSLDRALAEGRLVRPLRGTFALPATSRSVAAAVFRSSSRSGGSSRKTATAVVCGVISSTGASIAKGRGGEVVRQGSIVPRGGGQVVRER